MKTNMIIITFRGFRDGREYTVFCIPLLILTWSYLKKKNLYFIKEQLKIVYEKIEVREIIYFSEL